MARPWGDLVSVRRREARHLVLAGAVALASAATIAPTATAQAADASIAIGEVSGGALPGTDAASVKSAAEGELLRLDRARLPRARTLVVSLAVVRATDSPVACTINATVRDKRSGTMLAILEGRARAEGGVNDEVRAAVVRAAVKSAVRQIPDALPRR